MSSRHHEILAALVGKRLAVVGDGMLDRFLWGRVDRISPEAPVPVVSLERETLKLGGAANVAGNIRALGAEVALVSVCGRDEPADRLRELLAERGIDPAGLLALPDRPTTVKTRIIAGSQQVVRADRESREPLGAGDIERLLAGLRSLGRLDGLVLSDYGKGVLTAECLRLCLAHARDLGIVAVVDPKNGDFRQYHGATSLTPNQREAALACAREIVDDADLGGVGRTLLQRTGAVAILITRGEHGMALFEAGGDEHHLPTEATEVFDVTGAGDTVIATYTSALVAGASFLEAAGLANHAAGLAVRELGTAAITAAELAEAMER